MSAITTTLRRHPSLGAGAIGAMAGTAAGVALGLVIAFALAAPPIVQQIERQSPLGQAQVHEQLQQHVVRENATIIAGHGQFAPTRLLHEHTLREYGLAAPTAGTLDMQPLLHQHVLRENGAP